MVIRGSLIEADSIQAKSISQTYTDDVLDQAFVASEGLVESMYKQISEYLSNEDGTGQIDVLQTTIADLRHTIDSLTLSYTDSYRGGINYVQNSSGLNGVSDDWSYTGVVSTQQNNDTKNSTVANSCFSLSENSTLSQTIDNIVVGTTYTISLKVKKTASLLSEVKVKYNGTVEATVFSSSETCGWEEYSCTIASVQSPSIELTISTRSSTLYVADIMFCEGTSAKAWTPAPNEIYTSGVKLDKNGIEVYRSGTSEKTVMNTREFAGYYNDEEVFSLNKDETRTKKTVVNGELTVGTTKFIPFTKDSEGGLNITIID